MAALVPETARRIFTPETLRSAARQSEGCHVVSLRLRRAIKKFLREQEEPHMKNKVFRLSQSFNEIKGVNLLLTASTSRELVEDPLKSMERSKRWKIKSAYGDIGLTYRDHETVAYVASRMPAVYSACFRVLSEVRRRLPGFSPAGVLDFGSGTGSALWALREVWPDTLERINLVEPSKSMQRVGQRLLQDQKNLPLIHSYDSIQALAQKISKSEREHDLVIASYVLGEIPSLKDRITIVRQLWDLTRDVLVLVEPGTPQGSSIISQMRSHILWMEKRRIRKKKAVSDEVSKDKMALKAGAYIVAPCPHDGVCPLEKTGKYCHFVQRLQRTTSQRAYKRSRGEPLRGFEDEKFCFVAFRRGQRPREPWPLDGMKFETLEEQRSKRNLEDLEIDYEDQFHLEEEDTLLLEDPVSYDSDVIETDAINYLSKKKETDAINDDNEEEKEKEILRDEETTGAELGSGWGRIIFSPVRRGKQVAMNVCRATNREGTQGSFERMVITQSENPKLHLQARRSLWGDLWPF